ncbi:cell division protein FtsA [Patescibacteria group bacterium]|nr:cell division protein FtsA [Patescibacteria group bacterium]MBU2218942.1 cell division protein FtsA [Patescibacteria group bacterium]MBU2263658.1 cell division protein FtsA [Patescibacteria group bacterium]
MARNIITGIDAGTSAIKVVVAELKDDRHLHILSASQRNSSGIRRGYITNFEDAAESIRAAIKTAEKMAAVPIKHAYIAVGGISLGSVKAKESVMVSRADAEITDYDIKRVLDQCEANTSNSLSNKQIIHEIPLHFKIDNNNVPGRPVGMKGNKLEAEVLYITCLSQHLADLIKNIELTGVTVDDIIASPLAASLVAISKHQKEAGCVLANLGAGTVSIIVFEEDIPISLEVFPIGSKHITNDIALGFQIPLEEAEKLKVEFGADISVSKRKLNDIIEARLNDIFELIESHLKKINRNGLLPAGIILTGGGAGLFSLEEIAKSSLRLPAKVSTPLPVQGQELNIIGNYKDQVINDPGWSVALGLCVWGMRDGNKKSPILKSFLDKLKFILKRWFKTFLP